MPRKSASELLQLWEQGRDQPSARQGLILLKAACPDKPWKDLAEFSVGMRDANILALREEIIGPNLVSLSTCPRCGDQLELTFEASKILSGPILDHPSLLSLNSLDYDVTFRLPNSLDLIAVEEETNVEKAREILIERCLIKARKANEDLEIPDLPDAVIEGVEEEMSAKDPQADLVMNLSCPSCSYQWQSSFDITSFFWTEMEFLGIPHIT